MTKKQKKKTHKLEFGTAYKIPHSGGVQARISVDFKKILNSWFNVSDFLPYRAGINTNRLKNIFPTTFQRRHSESSSRKLKTHPQTSKQNVKRFYIDMNKLEEIKTLDSREKENLIQILKELKCDHDTGTKQKNKHYNNTKKNKKRSSAVKKTNKSFPKDNKIKTMQCSCTKKNKSTLNTGKSRKSTSTGRLSQCNDCKQCYSEMLDNSFKSKKMKQKQPATTIVQPPETLLLQTLMADPRAFGDIHKQQIGNTKNNSSSSINTIFRKNQNICIKNIELKYLKPTYVVQYNTKNDTSSNDKSIEEEYRRERLYSTAALDAHLGQTSAPDYHEGKPHAEKTSMHYIESNLRIIGMGHGTEEMLRKRENSSIDNCIREDTRENVPRECIIFPNPQTERVTKWQRDPLPSYLLPKDQRGSLTSLQTNPVKNKEEPKSGKCIDFIKKCFCLPTEKQNDQNKLKKVHKEKKRTHKDEFVKIKENPQIKSKDVPIFRITQDDFFHENRSKNKYKQKTAEKGKAKKVSFRRSN